MNWPAAVVFLSVLYHAVNPCNGMFVKNEKRYVRLHWLFLHYHKTGAFLSEAITQSVSADRFTFKGDNNKRLPFSTHNRANVILSHAGNLLYNWTTSLVTPRFQYRVIHFVRDPYEMVLSGFLYHSQRPPPEHWLMTPRQSPCTFDPKQLHLFVGVLSSYHSTLTDTDLLTRINQVVTLCEKLDSTHSMVGGEPATYAKTLQSLRGRGLAGDALRLEACRALISSFVGAGGDIIRMGANAVREGQAMAATSSIHTGPMSDALTAEKWIGSAKKKKHKRKRKGDPAAGKQAQPPQVSLRFFLSEFPWNSTEAFEASIRRMFQFLMSPPESVGSVPFWRNKLTQGEAVRIATKAGLLRPYRPKTPDGTAYAAMRERRLLKHIGYGSPLGAADGTVDQSTDEWAAPLVAARQLGVITPQESGGKSTTSALSQAGGKIRVYSTFRGSSKAGAATVSAYQDSSVEVLSAADMIRRSSKRNSVQHVTKDMWPAEKRQKYITFLSQDPIIAPLLNLVRNILHFPLPYKSPDPHIRNILFNYSDLS